MPQKLRWLTETPPTSEARLTRRRSRVQEDRIAGLVGGRRQAGSGAFAGNRGDVRHPGFLVECKTTSKGSLRVDRAWLEKITAEAAATNREPAFAFAFEGPMAPGVDRDWIAVPARLFPRVRGVAGSQMPWKEHDESQGSGEREP